MVDGNVDCHGTKTKTKPTTRVLAAPPSTRAPRSSAAHVRLTHEEDTHTPSFSNIFLPVFEDALALMTRAKSDRPPSLSLSLIPRFNPPR